jgi:GTPase SAR1 family protein
MSKRRHSSPIEVTEVRPCLVFDDWKAQQAATEGTRRTEDAVYDPTTEALPDHPWYTLDQELLRSTIIHMCNKLGRPVKDSQIDDPEIVDLLRNLTRATAIPHPSKVNVAVVGNQGVGKSSIINALLNRDLVDASASSSACTAFATIIQHKDDAKDDTDVSDLKVTFLEIAEIREFIEEHIRRYVDVYTPGGIGHNDATVQEADAKIADNEDPEVDISDSDFSDASEIPVSNKTPQKKVSKVEQKGADTAELFFRIIFNGHRDITKEVELQNWLNEADLEDGRFLDHCAKLASEYLAQIQAEEGGSVEYSNVKDSDLSVVRQDATTMWPLIKAVSISTGSVLLRNGIRFMDLPGELNLISSIRKDGLTLNRLRRSQPNPYSGCE